MKHVWQDNIAVKSNKLTKAFKAIVKNYSTQYDSQEGPSVKNFVLESSI
jgi:hypothetical protein